MRIIPTGRPGAKGANGAPGASGPGLPAAGAIHQIAVKNGAGNYQTHWEDLVTSQAGAPGAYTSAIVIDTGPPVALYLWDMTTGAYVKVV